MDKKLLFLAGSKKSATLGGIRFIILQDREGTIQITIPKKRIAPEVLAKSDLLTEKI